MLNTSHLRTSVASVQMDVQIGDVHANHLKCAVKLREAADQGANLIVFPECALTGYGFTSVEEALPPAQEALRAVDVLRKDCAALDVTAIIGSLEASREDVYNAAFVIPPQGEVAVYRKCHLPWLGIDKHAKKGNDLSVFTTHTGPVGVVICYDLRFPESVRTLALRGAGIIAVPTNWPQGAETAPEFVTRARAYENRVFVIAANRIGTERGFTFIGRSQIIAPTGEKLAEADGCSETVLVADIDLALAQNKRVIIRPDEFEMDLIGDRRPEIYE